MPQQRIIVYGSADPGDPAELSGNNTYTGTNTFGWLATAASTKTSASSPYTAASNDFLIRCDATSASISILLKSATGTGRLLSIKKIDSGSCAVVISACGTDTIDGESSQTISAYENLLIQDAATGVWDIV